MIHIELIIMSHDLRLAKNYGYDEIFRIERLGSEVSIPLFIVCPSSSCHTNMLAVKSVSIKRVIKVKLRFDLHETTDNLGHQYSLVMVGVIGS